MTYLVPELQDNLSKAAKTLNSWSMLQNVSEGGPIPPEGLGLIVERMAQKGYWWSIIAVMLSFDGYLRESDWESIAGEDVSISFDEKRNIKVGCTLGAGARGEHRTR